MLHTKFRGNGRPVPEKVFKRFFSIYGHDSHLGHVTRIISLDFHFLLPESFNKIFASVQQSSF